VTIEEDYVRFDFVLKDCEARRAEGAPLVPFQLNVSDDAQGLFGVLPDDFEASQPRPVETDRLTFV
jgi:hypothetical protein